MIVKLHTQHLQTLEEIRAFLAGTTPLDFAVPARQDAYAWIEVSLRQLGFLRLGKADKGLIRDYLPKVSGFSRAQSPRIFFALRPQQRVDRQFSPSCQRPCENGRQGALSGAPPLDRSSSGLFIWAMFGPLMPPWGPGRSELSPIQ